MFEMAKALELLFAADKRMDLILFFNLIKKHRILWQHCNDVICRVLSNRLSYNNSIFDSFFVAHNSHYFSKLKSPL